MARKRTGDSERARQVVAQEAARLIIDHGIRDYRVAKQKAAERLGVVGRGEIEAAVADHLQIFNGEEHNDLLRLMRTAALSAMQLLNDFLPRLVGPGPSICTSSPTAPRWSQWKSATWVFNFAPTSAG